MLVSRPCHTLLCSFSLSLLLSPFALAEGPPPAEVSVEVAKVEQLSMVQEYAARTSGYREVEVRAQVSGILQERTYLEGSKVQKDKPLTSQQVSVSHPTMSGAILRHAPPSALFLPCAVRRPRRGFERPAMSIYSCRNGWDSCR